MTASFLSNPPPFRKHQRWYFYLPCFEVIKSQQVLHVGLHPKDHRRSVLTPSAHHVKQQLQTSPATVITFGHSPGLCSWANLCYQKYQHRDKRSSFRLSKSIGPLSSVLSTLGGSNSPVSDKLETFCKPLRWSASSSNAFYKAALFQAMICWKAFQKIKVPTDKNGLWWGEGWTRTPWCAHFLSDFLVGDHLRHAIATCRLNW